MPAYEARDHHHGNHGPDAGTASVKHHQDNACQQSDSVQRMAARQFKRRTAQLAGQFAKSNHRAGKRHRPDEDA